MEIILKILLGIVLVQAVLLIIGGLFYVAYYINVLLAKIFKRE